MENNQKYLEFYEKPTMDSNGIKYIKSLEGDKRLLLIMGILFGTSTKYVKQIESNTNSDSDSDEYDEINKYCTDDSSFNDFKYGLDLLGDKVNDLTTSLNEYIDKSNTPEKIEKRKAENKLKKDFLKNFEDDRNRLIEMKKDSNDKLVQYQRELEDLYFA